MMRLVTDQIRYPVAALIGACAASAAIIAVPWFAHTMEPVLLPVATHWTVESASRDGNDLILAGTMVKRRPCIYTPPIIVRDTAGLNYRMEHQSSIRGTSWAASTQPQRFGPWRIYDGAGKRLTFTSLFECHSLWPTFTELGVFDARNL
jgi:hypothetical protein